MSDHSPLDAAMTPLLFPQSPSELAHRLVFDFQVFNLPGFLKKRFTSRDAVVMDHSVADAFVARYGTPDAAIVTPDGLDRIPAGQGRILVLLTQGELAAVSTLRQRFPNRPVVAGFHDLAVRTAPGFDVRFNENRLDPAIVGPAEPMDPPPAPLVLLTTPGTDAEYVAMVMAAAGLGQPFEYLQRPHALAALMGGDLDVRAVLDSAARQFGQHRRFAMVLQSDVMDVMAETGLFDWDALAQWARASKARLIHVQRRDKLVQAGLAAVLAPSPFRSLFFMREAQRRNFDPTPPDFRTVNPMLQALVNREAALEDWFSDEDLPVTQITLEETVESAHAVMAHLGNLMGTRTPRRFDVPDYGRFYREMPALMTASDNYRRELIDRLGLHVNAHGSLVSMTDKVLKSEI
ncbi:hypothetical protein [Yunchengibacter salinarum]|uniref:hypothetical protein n=1 Tax=Yunchengibacter salinarum TaxID=3133399 RepID=UPI0035B57A51